MVTHSFLQKWDFKHSKSLLVTLCVIIRNLNVTSVFHRPLRRIESLAGGMASERDLQARGIMGNMTCCLVAVGSGLPRAVFVWRRKYTACTEQRV